MHDDNIIIGIYRISMTVFIENVNTAQFSSRSNRTRSRIEKSKRRTGGKRCRLLYRAGLNRDQPRGTRQTRRDNVRIYVQTIKPGSLYTVSCKIIAVTTVTK